MRALSNHVSKVYHFENDRAPVYSIVPTLEIRVRYVPFFFSIAAVTFV